MTADNRLLCKHCKKPFKPVSKYNVYCSSICNDRERSKRRSERLKAQRAIAAENPGHCVVCGAVIRHGKRKQYKIYCDKVCRDESIRRAHYVEELQPFPPTVTLHNGVVVKILKEWHRGEWLPLPELVEG